MKIKLLACSVLLASSSVAFAGGGEATLNLGGGLMMFDDNRNLENGTVGIVGLEYGFTENVAAEISMLQTSPSVDEGNGHVDVNETRLDGLYYFATEGRWLPYVAAGVGRGEFDSEGKDFTETQVNLGGGVRFIANDILSFRADLRGIHGLEDSNDDSNTDALFTIGMSWTFGDGNNVGKKKSAPVAKPVVKRAPAPAPKPVVKAEPAPAPAPVVVAPKPMPVVVKDTDGDGIPDSKDNCPNTAKGVKIGADGCKIKKVTVESIKLEITFPSGSSQVSQKYTPELKKVADFLNKHQDLVVEIEGHSDSQGKASYNKWLSQRRADAVKSAIIKQFAIKAERVNATGHGESKPVATNDTAAGRQANRRVIAVMQKEVIE